ncbi:MAG: sugar phosphate isomerase/epimerase [Desulfosarcina sp.]|nr:sugar phosphate isomerase/epimerase [Desulfobacterales bacterium]
MGYEFSLAHLTVLQCTPPEMVDIAAKTGYQYVSLRMTAVTPNERTYPLMDDRAMMKKTKMRLTDTGVRVLDIELARMDPATEPETYLAFLEAGEELGARAVICQLPDPERERATERFARLCDLAKPFDLSVDLEFPSWSETPDLKAGAGVIAAANRTNAGILVDTLHFDRSGSNLEDLKNLPREWFHFVHLCDAAREIPTTIEELIHTARADRYFPGEGGLNLREILDCMPAVPYSLEIPNDAIMKVLGPEEFARRAIRAAEKCLVG